MQGYTNNNQNVILCPSFPHMQYLGFLANLRKEKKATILLCFNYFSLNMFCVYFIYALYNFIFSYSIIFFYQVTFARFIRFLKNVLANRNSPESGVSCQFLFSKVRRSVSTRKASPTTVIVLIDSSLLLRFTLMFVKTLPMSDSS